MVDGLATISSPHDPAQTARRLEDAITGRGMAILARVDHAAAAATVGLELRPTLLLLFGNAKAGTPLMQAQQTMGIDLPLKFLVWQDESGATQVSYNHPAWLAARHGVDRPQITAAMEAALGALAAE